MQLHLLDVSDLEPCEPMQRILERLSTLARGEALQVRHRREPHLLYPMLEQQGMGWRIVALAEDRFELYIWHADDRESGEAIERLADR